MNLLWHKLDSKIKMSNLVIVESQAKAKTIANYLNSITELKDKGKFTVIACLGHIVDLPQKELGVNTENWEVTYVPIEKKKELIGKLKKAAKEAKKVYLASDLDLEGHAISFHLKNLLRLKRADYERVTFNEITKDALRIAFTQTKDIDMHSVQAQETRRILDRIIGYQLSPLLWSHFIQSKLSAGRVQSAALAMIVERYKNAKEHQPELMWELFGKFKADTMELNAKEKNDKIKTKEEAIQILKHIQNVCKWVATFSRKIVKKNPSAPFITSSLQQEVYQRYGIPAKKTMMIAQNLYEAGLITYMRTDSFALSNDAQNRICEFIEHIGDNLVTRREYKTKAANAQEAHECIRPTDPFVATDTLSAEFTLNHKKVYDLIIRRTVASQMAPAIYNELSYIITDPNRKYIFTGTRSTLISEGYLTVYSPDIKADTTVDKSFVNNDNIPVEPIIFQANAYVTQAQSLYNEPTLIKALEKEGIGRPSTFATIIDKLYDKEYVSAGQNPQHTFDSENFECEPKKQIVVKKITLNVGGKEKDRLVPTELGEKVIVYLKEVVPYLLDASFTSDMETSLDNIVEKKANKIKILNDFYRRFSKSIAAADAGKKVEAGVSKIIRDIPECKCQIINAKYGVTIYHIPSKKYHSLKPFLEWKEKEVSEVTVNDIKFILSLPIPYNNTNANVYLGPYGIYLKENGKNKRLDKSEWDKIY